MKTAILRYVKNYFIFKPEQAEITKIENGYVFSNTYYKDFESLMSALSESLKEYFNKQ